MIIGVVDESDCSRGEEDTPGVVLKRLLGKMQKGGDGVPFAEELPAPGESSIAQGSSSWSIGILVFVVVVDEADEYAEDVESMEDSEEPKDDPVRLCWRRQSDCSRC